MKTESGYMVINGGMAWGCVYDDGRSRSWGWCSIEDGELYGIDNPMPPFRVGSDCGWATSHWPPCGLIEHVERVTGVFVIPAQGWLHPVEEVVL